MFNRIFLNFKTRKDVIPLTIILSISPLPPLSTLLHLKKLGFYEYLPEKPLSVKQLKEKGYSKSFIELYREALKSQTTGSRRGLTSFIEEKLLEFKTSAEIAEMRTLSNSSLMNSLAIVVPTLITTLMLVTSPQVAPLTLILLSLVSLITVLALNIPVALSLHSYRFKDPIVLITLVLALPLTLLLKDPLTSMLIASIPAFVFSLINVIRENKLRNKILELVKTASQASITNIFKLIKTTPRKLFETFDYGVMKAVAIALYLISAYSPSPEAYDKLLEYTRVYVSTVKKIRGKFNAILVYSVIMIAFSVSTIYLTVFSIGKFSSTIPENTVLPGYYFISLPSKSQIEKIEDALDLAIIINAVAFSMMCAMLREGNPLYLSLYLPALLTVALLGRHLTLTYLVPLIVK